MSTSPLSILGQPTRSLEWLIGPDALLSSTALATGQLGTLGPIASLVEGGLDLTRTDGAASGLTGSATGIANQAVIDFHAALENLGHEVAPLNGPLHALTHLGETVGLGHIGQPGNIVTDLTAIPAAVAGGGGLASAVPLLDDLGDALGASDGLVASVSGSATGSNLLAPNGLLAPVSSLANAVVLDLHANIEGLGHDLPILNEALHGLTALGETVGLGHLGTSGNLLTDVVGLPGGLLGGQGLDALSPILGDLGHVTGAATGLLGDVINIPGSLLGGAATGTPLDGVLAPVTSLLGGLTGGHSGLPLDGLLGGLTGDGGGVLAPVTALLGGVTGGGGPLGGDLLGPGGVLQPVGNVANGLIDGIHANIENLGHDIPILNVPLHEVINLGTTVGLGALGEGNNLLTDVVNLPGDILSGNGPAGIGQVAGDVGHVADAAGAVVGSVPGVIDGLLSGGAGTGTPLDGVLGGLTGGGGGALAPVLSTVGGLTAGGTPLTGILGGLTGGGSDGTHPLIDVAAGPTTATPLANVGVLTPPADPAHTVQVGAIGVGAEQPGLLSAGLLAGDGIAFPATGGGGGDALVGHVLDIVHTATSGPADAGASHDAGLDLGVLSIDLGGHAEAHHTDPTPHGATGGLHLLGL
ncbi:hypothetical protein [Methylobacterium haplocladii]|uniref:Bacterial collagen-like protein middle domain-containing protein n=1 Tax=Methylobacterium haplocladii TaxID=1176176 RepID=A0A512INL8_9HYPH|nr:hypothetical protein [Methylobacterium haplocladii]GEO99307.1 hypothetical protein MHA02_16950 [Methylobacterium haplocladii]GJD83492.1 hypothetical protein HPGCJGGD_1360 [Methylobacterium haplocladii]